MAAVPTPGPPISTDNDQDGLPNEWERLFALNENDSADALLDKDNDGFSNLREYLAGTNPTDAADVLKLSASRTAGDLVLSFQAAPSRGYILYYSDVSARGAWNELERIAPSDESTEVHVTDPGPHGARRFYYLQLAP